MINCLLEQCPGPFSCVSSNSTVFVLLFMVCHLKYLFGRLKVKLMFPQTSFCFHLVNSNVSFSSYFEFNWSQHGFALGLPFIIFILVHQDLELMKTCLPQGSMIQRLLKPTAFELASKCHMHFRPVGRCSWWHLRPPSLLRANHRHGWLWLGFHSSSSSCLPSSPTELAEGSPQANW